MEIVYEQDVALSVLTRWNVHQATIGKTVARSR